MKLKELPTQEYLKECFDYDAETGLLTWRHRPLSHFLTEGVQKSVNSQRAGTLALNGLNKQGYCVGAINGIKYLAHRVIWKLWYGTEPELILHEDGNTGDNRINKLSSGEQLHNSKDMKLHSKNSSGIMGVWWDTNINKWREYIKENGKQKHLGYFTDFFLACCVRKSAESRYGFHPSHGKR